MIVLNRWMDGWIVRMVWMVWMDVWRKGKRENGWGFNKYLVFWVI